VYPNRCGNDGEVGLGGKRMPSLADEVVADSTLQAREETEVAITSKEPSEQREMETVILHSEDNLGTAENTGLCYTQEVFIIMKPMLQTNCHGLSIQIKFAQS